MAIAGEFLRSADPQAPPPGLPSQGLHFNKISMYGGPAEAMPLSALVGSVTVSHKTDGNLNISPKTSCGVLECDIVVLQNFMLMIL